MKRRTLLKSSGSIVALSVVPTVNGQSETDNVQLSVNATIPAPTEAIVTVNEDLDNDDTIIQQQTVELTDGSVTYELENLQGTTETNSAYWIEIELSTTDDTQTPSIGEPTILVPEPEDDTEESQPTERSGREFLFPDEIGLDLSIFFFAMLLLIGIPSVILRSPISQLLTALSGMLLLTCLIFSLPFIWFWIAVVLTLVSIGISGVLQGVS